MPSGAPGFGVILFDAGELGGGWAAVNGGPAVRVAGVGELDTGCLWLSNLRFSTFHEAGLSWNGWVRHSGYLRVPLDRAVEEWGFSAEDSSSTATYLSGLFGHVMTIAQRLGVPPHFRAPALAHELASIMPHPEFPSSKAVAATRHALQEWTRTAQRVSKDEKLITLQRPRGAHAADLLRCPVPTGPWKHVDAAKLPPMRRLQWVQQLGAPFFAKVQVHGVEAVGEVLSFGSGARDDDNRPLRREWVTAPELIVLSQFGDVEILAVWVGSECQPMVLPAAADELLLSPAALTSWSAGVVAENLWVGAALREQTPARGQEARISFRAAWLRADDRMRMFVIAQKLTAQGWRVHSYGTGAVRVVLPQDPTEAQRLLREAFALGLEPPLAVSGRQPLRDAAWGGDTASQWAAMLRLGAHKSVLLRLDALPVMAPADRERLFGDLMGGGR